MGSKLYFVVGWDFVEDGSEKGSFSQRITEAEQQFRKVFQNITSLNSDYKL